MRLYIPALGDAMILAKDWTFQLFPEGRNESLYLYLGIAFPIRVWGQTAEPVTVTLPIGTTLSVDRIYIRRGAKDFDSVTFNLIGAKTQQLRYGSKVRVRFWAKLPDANNIEFL
jgi:hypothetical protein